MHARVHAENEGEERRARRKKFPRKPFHHTCPPNCLAGVFIVSELRVRELRGRVIVKAPNMWTLTPRELVWSRTNGGRGSRRGRGGGRRGRRRRGQSTGAGLLVLRKRRATRGHFKNGRTAKNICAAEKRGYAPGPLRWLMATRLFN